MANIIKQGNSQPQRGKHGKSQNSTKMLEGGGCNSAESCTTSKPQSQSKTLYEQVTAFLPQQTNLCSLVKEHFHPDGPCWTSIHAETLLLTVVGYLPVRRSSAACAILVAVIICWKKNKFGPYSRIYW
ncbi:uncharacterized protein LOC110831921 [Zootermopsis nevadensis]|uniref:uncharacterized protein LOC110831921 n=1 Tax=Zootermopsis nevadensis TaxID=136037 RepID=UPI000B8EA03B|nr:uncharacterized protein LOC110831921 [Zootermopsis nevadensis]